MNKTSYSEGQANFDKKKVTSMMIRLRCHRKDGGPAKQLSAEISKITQLRTQTTIEQKIKATIKHTHLRSNQQTIGILAQRFVFIDLCCSLLDGEALTRCYVMSHWHSEWVNKRNWKTIESPPSLLWLPDEHHKA